MFKTLNALFGEYLKGWESSPRKENKVKFGHYIDQFVLLEDNVFGVVFPQMLSAIFSLSWYQNGYNFDRVFGNTVTSPNMIEVHPDKLIIHPRAEKVKLREFVNDDGLFALYINEKYMKYIKDISEYYSDMVYFKYDKKGLLSVHRECGDLLAVCLEVKV